MGLIELVLFESHASYLQSSLVQYKNCAKGEVLLSQAWSTGSSDLKVVPSIPE